MPSVRRRLKRSGQTADQIFKRLIEAILSGNFPSGSVVREAPLARDWKVSRTPLREAMRRAAEGGFIVLRPNQAPIIRPLTTEDIHNLYDLREVLELHALDLAWPHLGNGRIIALRKMAARARPNSSPDWASRRLKFDLVLHDLWTKSCGNSWLAADLERHYRFVRIFQSWIGRDPEALAKSYAEHLAILDAIEEGDKNKALAALRRHIQASARMVEGALPSTCEMGERSSDKDSALRRKGVLDQTARTAA